MSNTRHDAAVQSIENLIDEQIEEHDLEAAAQRQRSLDDAADDGDRAEAGDIVFIPANITRAVKGVRNFLSDRDFDADETTSDESLMESYFGPGAKDDEADYLE